ncbi:MAG TPA: hypothetical protein VHJ56_08325 [Candidatus Binatia bacterium]|nr:hypothetical protein [Candidatus Binatia bacterium]
MNVEASEAIVRGLKSAGVDLVAILPDPEERAKKVRPESLIDRALWERVAKSGLLEKLYGKKESAS